MEWVHVGTDGALEPARSGMQVRSDTGARPAPRALAERLTPPQLAALQRFAGNRATARHLQRDGEPKASMPPPNSSQPPDPEVIYFEGHALRFDGNLLYGLLKKMAEEKGLMAPAEFTGRFRTAPPLFLRGTERPDLLWDIRRGLDDANMRLDFERAEFCKTFEATANEAAGGLLDKSKDTIEAELERLGVSGRMIRGPNGAVPDFTLSGTSVAAAMRLAAAGLVPAATTVDETGRASADATRRLGESSRTDPFNLMNKPLVEEEQARRKRWYEATEEYEKQRRVAVAAHPTLAMYAEQPGAAGKLTAVSTMKDSDLANDVGQQAQHKLSNIEQVRPEIGKRFSVWGQGHLRRVTLDQMNATRMQRESVDWEVKKRAAQSADDKLMFSLIAIGLGLVSAIPTGGAGLMAGISIAAGAAGAGLALYQVGEEMTEYSLAVAASATDFDKAKAISHEAPDGLQLALDCVMALGDVFAAAAAFKALGGIVNAAKAGDVKAALRLAEVADSVGIRGASRSKIIGEATASLSGEAIEQVAKTAASGGGMSRAEYLSKMMAGVAEHSQFKKELQAASQLMEHVRGRIPDTARDFVNSGRVRVFNEASLIDVFGPEVGSRKWRTLAYADGFYSQKKGMIFLRSGSSPEDLAGMLIHEATHKLGDANRFRGNNFMSEAVAEFAERDFYLTLYAEGGPLAGQAPKSPRIQQFVSWTDEELMKNIETRYFEAKKGMDPAQRAAFKNIEGASADEVVRNIFDDIAADYEASLTKDI